MIENLRSKLANYTDILFKSWSDSLKIFLPSNLKNFILLTLNAYKQLWKDLFNSRIIYALIFFSILSFYLFLTLKGIAWTMKPINFELFIPYLFIYFYIRGARASIENKNWHYFKYKFFQYNFIYLFFLIIIGFLSYLVSSAINYFNHELQYSVFKILLNKLPSIFVSLLLFQLLICLMLFLFDSEKIYNLQKILKSTLTMFWYNLPFFLVSIILFTLVVISVFTIIFVFYYLTKIIGLQDLLITSFNINWKDFAIMSFIMLLLLFLAISLVFLMPLYICWITNFYIKRLHEQFSLYYKS